MYLVDLNDGKAYSLPALHAEWQELRKEDPENHAETFKREFLDILDATLRGRNDMDIVGPTAPETYRLFTRLLINECTHKEE